MGIEFVEKIHEQVYLQCAHTEHHVFLRLRSVAAVIPSGFLSLHPQVHQLLELTHTKQTETQWNIQTVTKNTSASSHLQGQHHQSDAYHDDHQQLGGPNAGGDVPEADGGEGDDAEVEGVEEREVFAGSFQVLDAARAAERVRFITVERSFNYSKWEMNVPIYNTVVWSIKVNCIRIFFYNYNKNYTFF